jgi:hypothetical protein
MEHPMHFGYVVSGRISVVSAAPILSSNTGVLEAEALNVEAALGVLAFTLDSFTLDSFIDVLVDNTHHYHEFDSSINREVTDWGMLKKNPEQQSKVKLDQSGPRYSQNKVSKPYLLTITNGSVNGRSILCPPPCAFIRRSTRQNDAAQ